MHGKIERQTSTHGVARKGKPLKAQSVQPGDNTRGAGGHALGLHGPAPPTGTMAGQIDRQHVKIATQGLGHGHPVFRCAEKAMEQQQGRLVRRARQRHGDDGFESALAR